ncbi:MAG: DivIVA domain-containing protein [Oscillospiraceae bacterium]|nr:DivIVA domain-containing protein [Oscillospiraceae bacterium]
MNAKDISSRKFDRGFNGYKLDDVDSFLSDVASEFAKIQKENRDLEKKLEVLADKVREYRDDEEALKEAMLSAQKTGQAAIAEAKEKARQIVEEAQNKSDSMDAAAKENSEKMSKEADENLKKANDEAKRIFDEATLKNEKMEDEYKNRLDVNKEILYKTKNEVTRFRQKLMEDFQRATAIIEALPEVCENEFISKTLSDYQKERNVTLKKPAVKPAPQEEPAVKNTPEKTPLSNISLGNDENAQDDLLKGDTDKLYEEFAAQMMDGKQSTAFELNIGESMMADLTTEINFEPVFDEEVSDENNDANNTDVFPSSDDENAADSGNADNPFYKKKQNNPKEREPLEFGANAKNGKNK